MYGTVAGWLGIPLIWKVWRAAPADPGDEVVPPGSHVLAVWLAFPLELLLSSITGRDFEQYYMAWVPSMALLTGYFLHFLSREIIPSEAVTFSRRNVPFVLLGLLIGGMWLQAIVDHAEKIAEGVSRIDQFDTVTGYLSFYTAPDEPVLMWGAETAYVFTSNRYSPTRYVYQYPLLYPEYVTDEKVNEFLHDLQADPPIVIMDTFPSNADVPPLDSLPGPIGDFFRANYDRAGTIDTTGWPVYRLKGHPETP
jgi:hypothetical protein